MKNQMTSQQRIEGVSTASLLERGERAIIDGLTVSKNVLPESFHGKKPARKLRSVVNESQRRHKKAWRDPREVSSSPERKAIVSKYAENPNFIEYKVDDDRLYRSQLNWAKAMVAGGLMDIDDLKGDDEI